MKKALLISIVFMAFFFPDQAQTTVPLLDSIISYKFNSEQDSTPTWKWEYHYNLHGLQIFYGLYSWNAPYGRWDLVESDTRVFNQSAFQIEQVEYAAYERGLGRPYVKHEWEYDTNGNPLIMHQYYKFEAAEEWTPDTKEEFKNDPDGVVIQKLRYSWHKELNDWYTPSLYTFEYNSSGSETKQYIDSWDSGNSSWRRSSKIETSYDPDGVKRSQYWYRWNSEQSDWTKRDDQWMEFDSLGRLAKQMESNIGASILTEYVYDSAGNFVIYYSSSPAWIGNFHPTIKFCITINENQERKIVEEYHIINQSWSPVYRTENIYSTLGIKLQTNLYTWADLSNGWNLGERSHYYYQNTSAEVITVEGVTHRIFPNPTAGMLTIDGLTEPAAVKVYSMQGQLLKSVAQVEKTIDISDLPTGVYILNLVCASKSAVRKLVVKR